MNRGSTRIPPLILRLSSRLRRTCDSTSGPSPGPSLGVTLTLALSRLRRMLRGPIKERGDWILPPQHTWIPASAGIDGYARVSELLFEVRDDLGGEKVEAAHDLLEGQRREIQEQGEVPAARL